MDFLGIGPFELLLILVLSFLFFGPEKLPGIASKAGRVYRKLRKASSDFGRSFTEDMSSYSKGMDSDLKEDGGDLRRDLDDLRRSILDDIVSEKPSQERKAETEPGVSAQDCSGDGAELSEEKDGDERG